MKNKKQFRAKAILLMFIIVSVLTVISCRKPTTYNMPQDLKDYCMFPVGSWWVYEDSISGEKDSIVLMEQSVFIDGPDENFYWESISQVFYSSLYNVNASCYTYIYRRNPLTYNYFFGKGSYFSTDDSFLGDNNVSYIYSDSTTINNIYFYKIKIFEEYKGTSNYGLTYWAKNIGVIKYVNPNFNWELKSYYINK